MEFRPGDVVQRECGGSYMNVRAATRVSAFCTWLDLRGDRQVGVFLLPELRLVQRLEPPAWWASRYPQPQLTD